MAIEEQFTHVTIESGGEVTIQMSDGSIVPFIHPGPVDPTMTPCRFATLAPVEKLFGAELVTHIVEVLVEHSLAPRADVVSLH